MNDELIVSNVNDGEDLPAIADDTIIAAAENAEKRIEAMNKIKTMSLRVTNKHDWVSQQDKPYLLVSGAEKIARLFGVSWTIDEPQREDEESGHFIYTYKGTFSLSGKSIHAIGTRSSKDGFFKRYKYEQGKEKVLLPPSEIDKTAVKKAAYTNCIGNGITRLLGIRNLTWEDLGTANITLDSSSKVNYNQAEESKESTDHRGKIRSMILEMSGKDENKAKALLEELTSFVPKGKTEEERVKGKTSVSKLTEKQLQPTYGRVKEKYEAWQKDQKPETGDSQTKKAPAPDELYDPEKCATCLNLEVQGKPCSRLDTPAEVDSCAGIYE